MRIISGLARGIVLTAPKGSGVRPTTDRVKEAVFASLEPLLGLHVLDLFAGSGALGLEALSRGAANCVFVERDRQHLRVLQDNLDRVRKAAGDQQRLAATVLAMDVRHLPQRLTAQAGNFDLILADPPYAPGPDQLDAAALVSNDAFAGWAQAALLVLEHPTTMPMPWAPLSNWRLLKQKTYANTTFSFARQTLSDTRHV